MDHLLTAGLVQLQSTPDIAHNLRAAAEGVAQAARMGARLICLPENTPFLGPADALLKAAQAIDGEYVGRMQEAARAHGAWVLLGSFPERGPDPQHTYNTSALIDDQGQVRASYRKIHLFDVETPSGERLHESATVSAGDQVVVAQVGPWRVGLSVCYDLRFPELYRAQSAQGAHLLCVPAAFTAETGRDHWHALLRARAIENLAYVVAPNQWGAHYGSRRSYGRSVIFDHWGNGLAGCPDRVSVAVAALDLDALLHTRAHFPALTHRRL